MFHLTSPRSVVLAAALMVAAAGIQAKESGARGVDALRGVSTSASGNAGPSPRAAYTDVVFDVSGILSNEEQGDALNEVHLIDLAANAHIIGIGWDTTQFADDPSWLSEMVVNFGSSSAGYVDLTPGIGEDFPGTASYSSGGVINIVDLALDFNVDADGKLRLEFFESFNDFDNDWDGVWENGSLTIRVESVIPEPSTYALMGLGLAGVAAWARRRNQKQA